MLDSFNSEFITVTWDNKALLCHGNKFNFCPFCGIKVNINIAYGKVME